MTPMLGGTFLHLCLSLRHTTDDEAVQEDATYETPTNMKSGFGPNVKSLGLKDGEVFWIL
jgi:hypothetical protein